MSDKQGEPGQVPWPQGRHQGVEPGAEQVPWRRVCLIDDDPINNLVCERLLISIFACQDVKAFLEAEAALHWLSGLVETQWPELILLDINMPVMNGWEFLDAFAVAHPQASLPICLLSSSVYPSDRLQAENHPQVSHFLTKPLTRDKLLQLKV